jgi:hypothetical protein
MSTPYNTSIVMVLSTRFDCQIFLASINTALFHHESIKGMQSMSVGLGEKVKAFQDQVTDKNT